MNDIAFIKLKNGSYTIVDADLFPILNVHEWRSDCDGYTVRKKGRRQIFIHRIINNTPKFLRTDHINGYKFDNTRRNLRIATKSQNQQNKVKSSNKSSIYKGVVWLKNNHKWMVRIVVCGKCINLGCFNNEVEAAQEYDKAAKKYFGAYAKLNFPLG